MIKAIRTENGNAEIIIDGEKLVTSKDFSFLKQPFKAFNPAPQEGNPEKLFFFEYVEPLGFSIVDQTKEEEPEEDF